MKNPKDVAGLAVVMAAALFTVVVALPAVLTGTLPKYASDFFSSPGGAVLTLSFIALGLYAVWPEGD